MSEIVTASQLAGLRDRHADLVLLDVRLPEDFAAAHLSGAVNQCVFEVVFLTGLEEKGFRRNQPLCVYGAAEDSHESRIAVEKLEHAGYTTVFDFRGGLESWIAGGRPIERQADTSMHAAIREGRHDLDTAQSNLVWIGRNLMNRHWGHVPLSSGHVEFRNGMPSSGEAVLDMRRITCADLAGDALHDVLIHHLESDDFFDVARFPEARFRFDRAEICSTKAGCRNLRLLGELTLRGITKPLVIEAAAGLTTEGKAALQAAFTIDRTEWGVLYGSGKFFRKLAGHLVNDEVEIQLRIITG